MRWVALAAAARACITFRSESAGGSPSSTSRGFSSCILPAHPLGSPETLLPAGSRGGGGGNDLEDSVPRVLQLLGDVRRRAVEVGGDAAARVRGQREELRAKVSVGDVLVGVTAVRYIGGEYLGKARPERDIFPAGQMDFDTVVDAISSNEEPELSELKIVPHASDVILRMRKG